MKNAMTAFTNLNTFLCRISLWLAASGLIAMTAIVFAQVFMRYVFASSLHWVEPVSLLLMSLFIFLGSAVGVREAFHMGFDVLMFFLPERFGGYLKLLSDLAVFLFGVCMSIYGMQLILKTWSTSIPIIKLPGGFSYIPLFIGGVLITLFVLEHMLKRVLGETEKVADLDDMLISES